MIAIFLSTNNAELIRAVQIDSFIGGHSVGASVGCVFKHILEAYIRKDVGSTYVVCLHVMSNSTTTSAYRGALTPALEEETKADELFACSVMLLSPAYASSG